MMGVLVLRSAMCAAVAAIVIPVISAGAVVAQTPPLGEVARKEAERRKGQPAAGKVYTNKDLPASAQDRPPLPSPYADPPGGEPAAGAPGSAAEPAPDAGAAKEPVRDEAWWRGRMAKARQDVRASEIAAEALQMRINALGRDFVSRDNPVQRAQIGEERSRALEELSRLHAEIERSRHEVEQIEEEARRAGVPPGWLR